MGMTAKELKIKCAKFKQWYITERKMHAGVYRIAVSELSTGVRYLVQVDNSLGELWKDGDKGYERII
jgi:hypothetical protein